MSGGLGMEWENCRRQSLDVRPGREWEQEEGSPADHLERDWTTHPNSVQP